MVTIKVTARSLSSPMTAQSREWWKMPVTRWVPRRWFLVSKTRRRREGAPDGVRVSLPGAFPKIKSATRSGQKSS